MSMSTEDTHKNVHGSFIYNRQKQKNKMYPSTIEWMIYSYIEMIPRKKEEVTTATRIDIRNSHRLDIEPKEARRQGAYVMSPCI